jgi:uncharacterized protein (TIGR03435 family)
MMAPNIAAARLSSQADGLQEEAMPAFEVASIKLHDPGDSASGNFFQGVDRWVARNYTLRQLVRTAYQIQDYRVIGGPAWADTVRYDIDAKASQDDAARGGGPAPSRLLMVRSLLADRFKLRVRREQRELPVYELRVARRDGKLGSALKAVDKRDCVANAPGGWCGVRGQGPGRVMGQQVTIDTIVMGLGGTIERVVVNRTGLTGVFDFTLQFTPQSAELANSGAAPADVAPSIFTAVEEQLGLKLHAERAAVDILVIESAEKPSN